MLANRLHRPPKSRVMKLRLFVASIFCGLHVRPDFSVSPICRYAPNAAGTTFHRTRKEKLTPCHAARPHLDAQAVSESTRSRPCIGSTDHRRDFFVGFAECARDYIYYLDESKNGCVPLRLCRPVPLCATTPASSKIGAFRRIARCSHHGWRTIRRPHFRPKRHSHFITKPQSHTAESPSRTTQMRTTRKIAANAAMSWHQRVLIRAANRAAQVTLWWWR